MHKCLNMLRVRGDRGIPLSPQQVGRLKQLASAEVESVVARRALIVLAEHRRRSVAGSASSGAVPRPGPVVSRQTAAKWFLRYAERGAEGLVDLPRAGRPVIHGDDSARSILVAPLLMTTLKWTSHTVAQVTGQSQSAVVRAWRVAFTDGAVHLADALPWGGLALVGARVDATNSLLVLAAHDAPVPPGRATPFMRSPRRPPFQAILAADLLAASAHDPAGPVDPPVHLVEGLRRHLGAPTPLYVLSRRPLSNGPATSGVEYLHLPADQQWQGLLEALVRRCTATPQPRLVALQQQLVAWAHAGQADAADPGAVFEWNDADSELRTPRRVVVTASGEPRASGQVVADAVLATIMERITSGRLAAGDRVTESSLSRAVHASRGHVREALLALASSGLVDLEPRRGALVPAPQVADVVETYAVRRALGALLVRRAAHTASAVALARVELALADLVSAGETGDAWASGQADIRFQDALARCTGMRRIPRMFIDLSAQMSLFTAVMGVRYTYSIPQMIRDDTDLLQLITARDEPSAVRAWHAKMDDALSYMVGQLGSGSMTLRRQPAGGAKSAGEKALGSTSTNQLPVVSRITASTP